MGSESSSSASPAQTSSSPLSDLFFPPTRTTSEEQERQQPFCFNTLCRAFDKEPLRLRLREGKGEGEEKEKPRRGKRSNGKPSPVATVRSRVGCGIVSPLWSSRVCLVPARVEKARAWKKRGTEKGGRGDTAVRLGAAGLVDDVS